MKFSDKNYSLFCHNDPVTQYKKKTETFIVIRFDETYIMVK